MIEEKIPFDIAFSSNASFSNVEAFKRPFSRVEQVYTFEELCGKINNPIDLMCTLIQNNIAPKPDNKEFEVYWPEDVMLMHQASCFDIAEFVREFCHQNIIDYRFVFIGLGSLQLKKMYYGHVVPLIKDHRKDQWFAFNYLGYGIGNMSGPFTMVEDAAEACAGNLLIAFKSLTNQSSRNNPYDPNVVDYIIANTHDLTSIDIVRRRPDILIINQQNIYDQMPLKARIDELIRRVQAKINKNELYTKKKTIAKFPLQFPMFKNKNALLHIKNILLSNKKVSGLKI